MIDGVFQWRYRACARSRQAHVNQRVLVLRPQFPAEFQFVVLRIFPPGHLLIFFPRLVGVSLFLLVCRRPIIMFMEIQSSLFGASILEV